MLRYKLIFMYLYVWVEICKVCIEVQYLAVPICITAFLFLKNYKSILISWFLVFYFILILLFNYAIAMRV